MFKERGANDAKIKSPIKKNPTKNTEGKLASINELF